MPARRAPASFNGELTLSTARTLAQLLDRKLAAMEVHDREDKREMMALKAARAEIGKFLQQAAIQAEDAIGAAKGQA